MSKYKNIIFDYGNVIFRIDFNRCQQSFVDLGIQNVEDFFSHSGHHPLFNEFEKGNISAEEFREGIRTIARHPDLTDNQIDTAWNSLLIGVPRVNHEALLATKEQYRTFLLSNNNQIHYEWIMDYLKREYNLESNSIFFEKDYYSHLMGMRKPDPEIFEYVLHTHQLKVEETLFIDDSPQHLKTAASLGLHTHLLTLDNPLPDFLKRSGILSV